MKLTRVLILFCCTNGAKGITSPITDLAIQEYKINRQLAQIKLNQAGRHRSSKALPIGSGPAIGFAELLKQIKKAQRAADARRRGENNLRRSRQKLGGRIQAGTMEAFRRMQKIVGTYV